MDFREQLFTAVDNTDLNKIDDLFSSNKQEDPTFMEALFVMQRACRQQNLEVVRHLLPYATEFFFEGKGPRDPFVRRTMEVKPYDTFFELLNGFVLPTQNIQLFEIFVTLILNNIHSRERANLLVQYHKKGHSAEIDCVLPFVDDMSIFDHAPAEIKAFFEQRKAEYQKDVLLGHIDGTASHNSPPTRKI